jgi:hypothetical protein
MGEESKLIRISSQECTMDGGSLNAKDGAGLLQGTSRSFLQQQQQNVNGSNTVRPMFAQW